jgi:F0F1-type ATP synthase membrane subunit b/b'
MTIWWLLFTTGCIVMFGGAFIALFVKMSHVTSLKSAVSRTVEQSSDEDIEHIFNKEFREELRNRGRLHFEKILGENAMFLQQDLRLTTAQLNDHMKSEINRELTEAFKNYQEAISDAKQSAVESIEKTKTAIDEQRQTLTAELETQLRDEKHQRLEQFDKRMAEIVNHYVLEAIGDQIDLSDQLEYIMGELEANKQAILEDVKSGA